MLSVTYAECHLCLVSLTLSVTYAACHLCCVSDKPYTECRYAECHYAECQYKECRGALLKISLQSFLSILGASIYGLKQGLLN